MSTAQSAGSEWWRAESQTAAGDASRALVAAAADATESRLPFWAMMTFTFILFIAPQLHFPALAPFRIALLTAIVAITTYLFDRVTRGQPIIMRTREMWITAGLIAWAILTVPFSNWPGESVSFLLDVYFKTLAIFWLLSHTVNTLPRLRLVVWALTLMTVPTAVTALDNFISGTFTSDSTQGVDRIVGYDAPLTGNPNGLALTLNLILPLSVALFLIARRTLVRAGLLAVIALDVIAVVVTFSRTGFLTLATTFAMYLWKLRKRPEGGWAVAALLIAVVCIPLFSSSYLDRVSTIINKDSDPTGSAQARWSDMVAAANLVVRNPIVGAGVGTNTLALNEERGPYWLTVHNVYLQYAVDLGIPGLLLFILLLVRCINNARFVQQRSARVPAFQDFFYLAEAIQISLVAFAFAACFHTVAYELHVYYFAGLAVAAKAVYDSEERMTALDRTPSDVH